MVEIKLGLLNRRRLGRRIADVGTLRRETAAWDRNRRQATVDWPFTMTDARGKLKRLYPSSE